MNGIKLFFKSVKSAWNGICLCTEQERHFRIHLIAAAWVLMVLYTADAERWQYVAALVCIALVMGSEALNTAIERICDRICPENDPKIGEIKDMAAAATLICAFVSVAAALFLFASKDMLLAVLNGIFEKGWCGVFIAVLPVAAFLMLIPDKNSKNTDIKKNEDTSTEKQGKES